MGGGNDFLKPRRTVFVTVGSTCFDALVQAVDTSEVKEELFRKGYTDLLIQIGRGSYVPIKSTGECESLQVDYFTYSSSIADNLRSASLVISHAGNFFPYARPFTSCSCILAKLLLVGMVTHVYRRI
ncbi:hypothetical protein RHGRI_012930 [Rhododendron griersonianum]|uniref:Glycosyl transferase family 28 C-terminal domain-containing protein n=1 Tax=Rhododendron griersonianum TaxID=479676 RepID=A0AAV6K406_9ERIC|nr:hypothetical protein RHGRI_012930 [Rhododendron griersonianum]